MSAPKILISSIRCQVEAGHQGFDFSHSIPPKAKRRLPWRQLWVIELLAGAAVLFLGPLCFAVWLDIEAAELESQRADLAMQARSALELRKQLTRETEGQAALLARWSRPPTTVLLETLAKTLQDDTWLFSVEVEPSEVTVRGFAKDVPSVLHRLEIAPFSFPELAAPIVHQQDSGRDRFEVRLRLEAKAR